ncbi:VWA domain-containing protein [Pseudomonas sp. 21LCFQ010]|uniref:VWA domain-containing protein n=1 Tax=Pseudomonas sp. 21LCFQ010 TaxID=2957506 RepID=UPI00209807E2|nr:VWA domain-containing protein [Pseudomonas sp. 21LCFQ010]MCO8165045.1 VWA domain-containing protein [Pseudomonas sp. 21LCFQ010]
MSAFWPYWLRPLWLLVIPLLVWLLYKLWHRQKRAGRWQLLIPPAFHAALLNGGNGRGSKQPWVVLGLAWLLAVLALIGPSWQRIEQHGQKPVDPLVVVLELTPQMLATDTPPSRLEQARRKLRDLLQARSDTQTAVVVYAGSAHTLVPLSDDLATSYNLIDAIKPSIMPAAGQRADLALGKALELLRQADLGQGRVLLMTSALNEQERQGIRQRLGNQSPSLSILGLGSNDGVPVTQENGGLLRDEHGAIMVARLDSQGLADFAAQVGGNYRQARPGLDDLRSLGLLDSPQQINRDGRVLRLDSRADQGYWLLLPLLLLAACAARRGWLFVLALLCVLPHNAMAFEFQDLWLRADQQGQRLMQKKRPGEAAQRFTDPRWKGTALYAAGDYAAAAQQFAGGDTPADHYNRGNALAMSGELEAALDAYEQALERQPDFPAAQFNLSLVQQALDQLQPAATDEPQQPPSEEQASPDEAAASAQQSDTSQQQSQAQHSEQDEPPSQTRDASNMNSSDAIDEADNTTRPPVALPDEPFDGERRQSLEHWLRQIPDDPGELLRRKFRYEQQHQETSR